MRNDLIDLPFPAHQNAHSPGRRRQQSTKATNMSVIFDGKDYRVRYDRRNSDTLAFVIFEPWNNNPSLDGLFTYENFFKWNEINSISVKPRMNDWYQGDEIEEVILAIKAVSNRIRLIGFGGSMGAYGLINFADQLNLSSIVAFAPQFSIDSNAPPYETRWQLERASINFTRHRMTKGGERARGYILFDPTTIDAAHARLINDHHDLRPLPLAFSNHFPMALLQQCKLLDPMLKEIADNRFDPSSFMAQVRVARRQSSWYWFHLSRAFRRHGRLEAAIRAGRLAIQLPDWQPIATAWNLSDLFAQAKRFDEAIEMIISYEAREDEFGDDARKRIALWRKATS